MALPKKFDRLLALRPDVAVVQECASPVRDAARGWRPPCTDYDWIGFNPDKGVGMFTFGNLRISRHRAYSDAFSLYLPAQIYGRCRLNLLGVWMADARKMPVGSTNDPRVALRHYRRFLTAAPAVVAGDFNLLPQQMSQRSDRSPVGYSVIERLARVGLRNADSIPLRGAVDNGLRRTLYHQRRFGRGFVVDYLFIPRREAPRLTAFEVCDPHDWLPWSDHVPLIAEFELTRTSLFIAR